MGGVLPSRMPYGQSCTGELSVAGMHGLKEQLKAPKDSEKSNGVRPQSTNSNGSPSSGCTGGNSSHSFGGATGGTAGGTGTTGGTAGGATANAGQPLAPLKAAVAVLGAQEHQGMAGGPRVVVEGDMQPAQEHQGQTIAAHQMEARARQAEAYRTSSAWPMCNTLPMDRPLGFLGQDAYAVDRQFPAFHGPHGFNGLSGFGGNPSLTSNTGEWGDCNPMTMNAFHNPRLNDCYMGMYGDAGPAMPRPPRAGFCSGMQGVAFQDGSLGRGGMVGMDSMTPDLVRNMNVAASYREGFMTRWDEGRFGAVEAGQNTLVADAVQGSRGRQAGKDAQITPDAHSLGWGYCNAPPIERHFVVEQIHRKVRKPTHCRNSGHPFAVRVLLSSFVPGVRCLVSAIQASNTVYCLLLARRPLHHAVVCMGLMFCAPIVGFDVRNPFCQIWFKRFGIW